MPNNDFRMPSRLSGGFTLIETLIALAIVTLMSLVVMGALAPWMGFKQKLDTERRLQDVRQGLVSVYNTRAMTIEAQAPGQFDAFTSSALVPKGRCSGQASAFEADAQFFSEAPDQLARDGYANPWCIWVTAPLQETRDGVTLWYRNIIVISMGANGVLDPGTHVNPDGSLVTAGDDLGITISGRDIQAAKLKETLTRMNKIAHMYETYFTTRYLANPARDISLYYFSSEYDTAGSVVSTGGNWVPASVSLANIGAGASDVLTAWETNNDIVVGNYNESSNGVTVRSPATSGTGSLPYTALLRATLPAPPGQTSQAVQVIVGNY